MIAYGSKLCWHVVYPPEAACDASYIALCGDLKYAEPSQIDQVDFPHEVETVLYLCARAIRLPRKAGGASFVREILLVMISSRIILLYS